MILLKVDTEKGRILLNNVEIQPGLDKISLAKRLAAISKLEFQKSTGPYEFTGISTIQFANESFHLGFSFRYDQLYQASLVWPKGPATQKEWDATEADLQKEKEQLAKKIEQELGIKRSNEWIGGVSYQLNWGAISVAIDLRNQSVSTTIHFKSNFNRKDLQMVLNENDIEKNQYALFEQGEPGQLVLTQEKAEFKIYELKTDKGRDGEVTFQDEAEAAFHFLARLENRLNKKIILKI